MKIFFALYLATVFISMGTLLFVQKGVPCLHCAEDNWGEEYSETTEWHEIGGNDPRYDDPCGPGPHSGSLGEPGCHGLD